MSTSGTVATTVIDTALVIDHAVRRVGLAPSTLSPEDLDTSRNNLYLTLSSITNRGVNLWCIDRQLISLYANQKSYTLPIGTVDVLNASWRTPAPLSYITTIAASNWILTFPLDTPVITCGLQFSIAGPTNIILECSEDLITWNTIKSIGSLLVTLGQWLWVDIDPALSRLNFRIRELTSGILSLTQVIVSSTNYEVPIDRYSRDQYESLTNKDSISRPLSYLYDKQLTPVMTVWPLPSNSLSLLSIKRQRQVQDVGSLSQKIEVPERWFEAIIWMLAKNLSFELKGVDPSRIQLCQAMSQQYLSEAEDGETDSAPIFIAPNIRGYTA
jgi:hypothetical protein